MWRPAWMVALGLLAAACTPVEDGEARSPVQPMTTTTSETAGETTTTSDPTVAAGPGRLAIIDGRGNVVVMDPDGSAIEEITSDAGSDALYTQPVWSPDGSTLAWGQVTAAGFSVEIGDAPSTHRASIEVENLPFYMYWSPDGSHLGVLRNGATGVDFEMVDVAEATSSVIDTGQPYYFSWSPGGDQVVTHVGADRFETIAPDGERSTLGTTDAWYLAPQWTAAGIFHVTDGVLVLEAGEGMRLPLVVVPGPTNFVASPRGSHVALQSFAVAEDNDEGLSVSSHDIALVPPGVLAVVDVASGSVDVVARGPALGFFWSPDGQSLLVLAVTPERDRVVPRVWRVDGSSQEYAHFLPPPQRLQDFFPFFPQYALSMTLWAPDSSAFAFAGAIGAEAGVWVQHIDEVDPRRVSAGSWVAWSSG